MKFKELLRGAQATVEKILAPLKEEKKRKESGAESDDIHQKMYEIATQNWNTVSESQGGSENFQEGPGGWQSGNGWNAFKK